MAGLVKCASCKREISHTTRVCPYCGDSDYKKRQEDKALKDLFEYIVIAIMTVVWFGKKNIEVIKVGFLNYRILTFVIVAFYIYSFIYFYYNTESYITLSIYLFILGQLVVIGISEIIKKIKK